MMGDAPGSDAMDMDGMVAAAAAAVAVASTVMLKESGPAGGPASFLRSAGPASLAACVVKGQSGEDEAKGGTRAERWSLQLAACL